MESREFFLATVFLLMVVPWSQSFSSYQSDDLLARSQPEPSKQEGDEGNKILTLSKCPYASRQPGILGNDKEVQKMRKNVQDWLKKTQAADLGQEILHGALGSSVTCKQSLTCDPKQQFRNPDGTCNNLAHPYWGSAGSCLRRELQPAYADCVSSARVSVSGRPLPSARLVSMIVHPQRRTDDRNLTNLAVMFGQLLTHDISLAAPVQLAALETNFGPGPNPTCLQGPDCMPIDVPENDNFYAQYNVTRIGMMRTETCHKCGRGPIYQMNQQTSYADLSQIYGYNDQVAKVVRRFRDGLLLSQELDGAEYLPASIFPYIDNCSLPEENAFCVQSGDVRVNQQPGLLSVQTLWMRDHNRIARRLACMNPHWDDERLFQVTRRIEEARYQHIVFSEWLPWQLGTKAMDEYGLWPKNTGWTSYKEGLDATLSNEFAAAHFRYAHSNIPEGYWRIDEEGVNQTMLKLKDAYFRPINGSYRPVDNVLRGSTVQPQKPFNRFGDHAVTHFLFRQPWAPYGDDLFAVDIQRGRDHGVRPYVDWVRLCQNITIADFDDLTKVMPENTAKLYAGVYEHVRDIDLFSGALSETRIEGAQLGETFACGVAKQFYLLKYADRFYYEHANQTGSFSKEQLDTIRETRIAAILCYNVVGLNGASFNRNVFLRSTNGKDGATCDDLPDIDLRKWKEGSGEGSDADAKCAPQDSKGIIGPS